MYASEMQMVEKVTDFDFSVWNLCEVYNEGLISVPIFIVNLVLAFLD